MITIIIGAAASNRVRPSRQTSAVVAFDDDLDLSSCVDAPAPALVNVVRPWTFIAVVEAHDDTPPQLLPVLASAPKTSPPWSRA
ncbi:MAG TPA: hypothetical protein VIV40_44385 [Kofleriaceae bacterium]